jgi:hypothetical protein
LDWLALGEGIGIGGVRSVSGTAERDLSGCSVCWTEDC